MLIFVHRQKTGLGHQGGILRRQYVLTKDSWTSVTAA